MNGEFVHRLWAVAWAVVLGCLALALHEGRQERSGVRRLGLLLGVEHPPPRRRWGNRMRAGKRWMPVAGALVTGYVLVGGVAGCVVGVAVALAVRAWLYRERESGRGQGAVAMPKAAAEAVAELPLAADLLAACVAAGATPGTAADAVGESLPGPLGERLARIAAELRLGGEPAEAWQRLAVIPGARELARCLARAGSSGAPAAESVSRLAAGLRAERSRAATARARTSAVLITAPVGLCFLPAFFAVGVAPVVIGLADSLLGGN